MYQEINFEGNPSAIDLVKEREDVLDMIGQLRADRTNIERRIKDTVGCYRRGELIRNTDTNKRYAVTGSKVLWCSNNILVISYELHPITKTGDVSRNRSLDQMDEDKIERTGKNLVI